MTGRRRPVTRVEDRLLALGGQSVLSHLCLSFVRVSLVRTTVSPVEVAGPARPLRGRCDPPGRDRAGTTRGPVARGEAPLPPRLPVRSAAPSPEPATHRRGPRARGCA